MRDLYRLMGLTPSASLDAIRTALEETRDAELRADVETVLLRPERKRDYDQIVTIGFAIIPATVKTT